MPFARGGKTGRLIQEQSPYLLQHAGNPVDWWPWCAEAFAEARRRDLPLLISIGYSACHWCHVMAHESFEDADVARVINDGFVAVKVDREERPDVDAVYMEAVQLVNGRGGWPMTVVALPDGRPFWAGTYLPKGNFLGLLRNVSSLWLHERLAIEADAARLAQAVRRAASLPVPPRRVPERDFNGEGATWPPPSPPTPNPLGPATEGLLKRLDRDWGGFGTGTKFPQPSSLEVLARHWWRIGDDRSLQALQLTLDAMSSGGIYDHLGGGFARYATDRQWLVPHFEKMLCDNALLVIAYTVAWQLTGLSRYRQVVEETIGYLLSPPMRLAEGAWASAEDADSEGEEGRFYTWSFAELREVGGPAAAEWYGASEAGNWDGTNILWRPARGELARTPELEEARLALLARRQQRERPGLDGNVITESNAMAVAALARAGAAFSRPGWLEAAQTTGEFLLANLRRADGRWLRAWRFRPSGQAAQATQPPGPRQGGHLAYAADYAWLVEAFTRLGESTGRSMWTSAACEAADGLLGLFWDEAESAFFSYGDDAEELIARMKDTHDGAAPSANAAAAQALGRLGSLTGEFRYDEPAARVVAAMAPALSVAPAAFCGTVLAADYLANPRRELVVTSPATSLVQEVWQRYLPDMVLAWGEPYGSPLWEGRTSPPAAGRAFLCEGYTCSAPVSTPGALAALLDGSAVTFSAADSAPL